MAQLTILHFPDPRLRTHAKPVEQVDDRIRQLIDDMFETMYEAPGVGLAATQVNVHEQIIVIDVSEERDQPLVFINPKIEVLDETLFDYEEGCLSVPGFYERSPARATCGSPRRIAMAKPSPSSLKGCWRFAFNMSAIT